MRLAPLAAGSGVGGCANLILLPTADGPDTGPPVAPKGGADAMRSRGLQHRVGSIVALVPDHPQGGRHSPGIHMRDSGPVE